VSSRPKSKAEIFVYAFSTKRWAGCSTKALTTVALGPASSTGGAFTVPVTVTASSQASRQPEVKLANLCYSNTQTSYHAKEHHFQTTTFYSRQNGYFICRRTSSLTTVQPKRQLRPDADRLNRSGRTTTSQRSSCAVSTPSMSTSPASLVAGVYRASSRTSSTPPTPH
jgi:hypothetical protein